MPKRRLYQVLRDAGIGSTIHETKQIIRRGEVALNQVICTLPNFQFDPEKKKITIVGKEISIAQEKVYFILNKPRGYSCQKNERIPFVGTLILYPNLSPVGRLDVNTTGLLIMTNDGELAARITQPGEKVEKTYQVTVDKDISLSTIEKLPAGVTITVNNAPYTAKATKVKRVKNPRSEPRDISGIFTPRNGKVIPQQAAGFDTHFSGINDNTLELTISEGKKRQIRLMMGALGYKVRGLQRIRIGNLALGTLREGSSQQVSKKFILDHLH